MPKILIMIVVWEHGTLKYCLPVSEKWECFFFSSVQPFCDHVVRRPLSNWCFLVPGETPWHSTLVSTVKWIVFGDRGSNQKPTRGHNPESITWTLDRKDIESECYWSLSVTVLVFAKYIVAFHIMPLSGNWEIVCHESTIKLVSFLWHLGT